MEIKKTWVPPIPYSLFFLPESSFPILFLVFKVVDDITSWNIVAFEILPLTLTGLSESLSELASVLDSDYIGLHSSH